MRTYARIYYLSHTLTYRLVRLLILLLLATGTIVYLNQPEMLKLLIFIFNVGVMWEIFVNFKINRVLPINKVTDADLSKVSALSSFTLPALYPFVVYSQLSRIIKELSLHQAVLFVLNKARIEPSEIQDIAIELPKIQTSAVMLSRQIGGIYVTDQDVVVAFLLESEQNSKLLQSKNLRADELIAILKWGRAVYGGERLNSLLPVVSGEGIGESLTSGWTPETLKYTRPFQWSSQVLPTIIGREKEYQMLINSLMRKEQDDCLIIGNSGTGKEHLIEVFAYQSYVGKLSAGLNHKEIIELLVGTLISGTGNRGELEERLQNIIAEIAHAGNVILYIPEIQNIIGASSFQLDLSGALLPYLAHSHIPIIATITEDNFKKYMEHSSLKEVFNLIQMSVPDEETAIEMVQSKVLDIEAKTRVTVTYKAVLAAVEHAEHYLYDQALPGSAVTLLTEAADSAASEHKVFITDEEVSSQLESKVNVHVHTPTDAEKDLLLHFEDKMHERIIDQTEAVSAISEALRRLRTGLNKSNRPISFLFLGPTGTGKTETVRVLSDLYFGGQSNIIRLDMSEYTSVDSVKRLLGASPGEGDEKGELTQQIKDHPASLVLLDEFEKAHVKILDLFLQILEDGRLTDNKGVTVSFIDSLIVATSNAGSEFIREEVKKGTPLDKSFQERLLDLIQSQGTFKPELLNRFDQVVVFKPLSLDDMPQIVNLLLNQFAESLKKEDITLHFDQAIIAKIVKEGFSEEFGARPLRRYIQDSIEDMIAKGRLTDEIKRGNEVFFSINSSGSMDITVK